MSKNPNRKSNDDDDYNDDNEDDDEDIDDETLRRGCCVKKYTKHGTRVHLGGAWNWTFRAERKYLDPKKEHPTMSMVAHRLIHLNSHLEVYIIRYMHRTREKKKYDQCYHKFQYLFLRCLWIFEPVIFIALLGIWKMDI